MTAEPEKQNSSGLPAPRDTYSLFLPWTLPRAEAENTPRKSPEVTREAVGLRKQLVGSFEPQAQDQLHETLEARACAL